MKNLSITKQKGNIDIIELIKENYDYIFPVLFYIAGLLLGASLYKTVDIDKIVKLIVSSEGKDIHDIFINKICIYLILYTLTILIGLCIFGFPVIQIVPFLVGFSASLKISCYYNTYSFKGFGYVSLTLIPQLTAFLIALIFTTIKAKSLSRSVYNIANNKSINEIDYSNYLKSFAIYFISIILISVVNSLMLYMINSIVKL